MSVINGRFVGLNDREFILRTGGNGEAGGGKIYPVDPAAVAHFKAVLAQQQAELTRTRRPSPGIRRGGNGRLDADLQRKVNELAERARARAAAQAAPKELDVTKIEVAELTETAVREAHGRFTQGESVKALATELGVPWQTLRAQFRQYGLPAGRQEARKRQPVRAAAKVETAVVPTARSQANPAAVADGMDRIISLGRLVRDLQAAGVDVKVSGKVVVELEF